jgi:hypothetical protein
MTEPDVRAELAALRAAALEDLMATPDAALRREAEQDGLDVSSITAGIKAAMREAAANALRQRLVAARQRLDTAKAKQAQPRAAVRPAIERLKQLVRETFANDPSLGLAFRDGKRQSDADWESLYDDLVSLGKIEPGDHAG